MFSASYYSYLKAFLKRLNSCQPSIAIHSASKYFSPINITLRNRREHASALISEFVIRSAVLNHFGSPQAKKIFKVALGMLFPIFPYT
jgi:hypothetical protein